ncbi:patatin-like phospholipase family protein [Sphingobacterium sp. N143]|uniref:patatin-like phospholipase family protein n=1 Tax=Sphingobacterium sp. N143 TaxID=2746727 RepID=UPI0025756B11|nr:patatin-like phospholipase family protein [Sphingobacterium sp. N143]MDM1295706.1 patatin-like phospholipase family protein [Sphingobacterium sp. N143]
MKVDNSPLSNGIQHIALSLSGGGFRAASYSLGCCSYLAQLPYEQGYMLDRVSYISAVSGGSITALGLFSMQRKGASFQKIYRHLLEQTHGSNLMDQTFNILDDELAWADRPDKDRNLINALAVAYDVCLFKGATYESLFVDPVDSSHPVINELCINATELNNGMNFRFSTQGRIGNQYLNLNRGHQTSFDTIKKIKLGDILAASSCFPAGFEPIVFPRDFTYHSNDGSLEWNELAETVKTKDYYSGNFQKPAHDLDMFALMDGGIDDNQGIYSFRLADARKTKGYAYDLYFPCDVSSNYLKKPFTYPMEKKSKLLDQNLTSLFTSTIAVVSMMMILFLSMLLLSLNFILRESTGWVWPMLLGFASFGLLLFLSLRIGLGKIQKFISNYQAAAGDNEKKPGTWNMMLRKYSVEFLKLPVGKLGQMLVARGNSIFLLANTIFLKKIRRASYEQLYTDGTIPKNQIAVTAVYLLSTKNDRMLQQELKTDLKRENSMINADDPRLILDVMQPSAILRKYIDQAAAMETTLWFDDYHLKDDAQESLLIAGQATMCFNLLRVALRNDSKHVSWPVLRAQLLEDWAKFNIQPNWMISHYAEEQVG